MIRNIFFTNGQVQRWHSDSIYFGPISLTLIASELSADVHQLHKTRCLVWKERETNWGLGSCVIQHMMTVWYWYCTVVYCTVLTGCVEDEGLWELAPAVPVHGPQPHLVLAVSLQTSQHHLETVPCNIVILMSPHYSHRIVILLSQYCHSYLVIILL